MLLVELVALENQKAMELFLVSWKAQNYMLMRTFVSKNRGQWLHVHLCMHVCGLSHAWWMRLCVQVSLRWCVIAHWKPFIIVWLLRLVFFVCFFAALHLFLSLTVSKWIADLGTAEKHPICFTTKASNVTRGLRADRLGERDEKKEKHRERWGLLSGGNDGDKKEKKMGGRRILGKRLR